MLNLLNVNVPIQVNGVLYASSAAAYAALQDFDGELEIILNPDKLPKPKVVAVQGSTQQQQEQEVQDATTYRVSVKQWMTKQFDFNIDKNNGVAMPMRTMFGQVIGETKGMYKMRLHGRPEPSTTCLHCGRTLKHPVSLLYGIGPICGEHWHINPLGSEAELQMFYEDIRAKLAAVQWEGWIAKSAIQSMEVVDEAERIIC